MSKNRIKKHIGPGKLIVSIYTDEEEYRLFQDRARSLGFSVSRWLCNCGRTDVRKGGPITISPEENRPFNPPAHQLAGFAM